MTLKSEKKFSKLKQNNNILSIRKATKNKEREPKLKNHLNRNRTFKKKQKTFSGKQINF